MLDHISLGVADLERSRRFYDAALRPLGIVRILDFSGRGSDYGSMAAPLGVEFTITVEQAVPPVLGMHVCFRASDGEAVRAFHAAALRAGGSDDGSPGPRELYHPDYYAAFVLDPDGHRIEAVCHLPQSPQAA
jgi:catechol 2,3-dioxygenase-like lactoylglutathione lyase family enzyme